MEELMGKSRDEKQPHVTELSDAALDGLTELTTDARLTLYAENPEAIWIRIPSVQEIQQHDKKTQEPIPLRFYLRSDVEALINVD